MADEKDGVRKAFRERQLASDGEHAVPAGHTNEKVADHVQQLIEEGVVVRDRQGVPSGASIVRLTSKGHDFVDATRNRELLGMPTPEPPGLETAKDNRGGRASVRG
jgi:hypothetical protein